MQIHGCFMQMDIILCKYYLGILFLNVSGNFVHLICFIHFLYEDVLKIN